MIFVITVIQPVTAIHRILSNQKSSVKLLQYYTDTCKCVRVEIITHLHGWIFDVVLYLQGLVILAHCELNHKGPPGTSALIEHHALNGHYFFTERENEI